MIEFWVDDKKKPYILDINKGEMLGLRGSALQSIPSVVRTMARQSLNVTPNSVMRLVYNGYLNADYYSWADRFDNIGYHPTIWELDRIVFKLTKDFNLGKFVKWWKENPNQDLEQYLDIIDKELWLSATGFKVDEMLTQSMLDYMYSYFRNEPIHNLKVIAYWLTRGRGNTISVKPTICVHALEICVRGQMSSVGLWKNLTFSVSTSICVEPISKPKTNRQTALCVNTKSFIETH